MQILSIGNFSAIDFFSGTSEENLAFEILDCSGDCNNCGDTSACFNAC